jgi:hypothetical protein
VSACAQTLAADAEEAVAREALEGPATVVLPQMEEAVTDALVRVVSVMQTPIAATTVGTTSA